MTLTFQTLPGPQTFCFVGILAFCRTGNYPNSAYQKAGTTRRKPSERERLGQREQQADAPPPPPEKQERMGIFWAGGVCIGRAGEEGVDNRGSDHRQRIGF